MCISSKEEGVTRMVRGGWSRGKIRWEDISSITQPAFGGGGPRAQPLEKYLYMYSIFRGPTRLGVWLATRTIPGNYSKICEVILGGLWLTRNNIIESKYKISRICLCQRNNASCVCRRGCWSGRYFLEYPLSKRVKPTTLKRYYGWEGNK
ncbi:hypothetical protein BGX38DRAFT_706539 [Terfezia claveryi]|nr:hypothetical protein BGX38DRAFT_706539 [Terfezia claveryi]